jgi:hypothetical protein
MGMSRAPSVPSIRTTSTDGSIGSKTTRFSVITMLSAPAVATAQPLGTSAAQVRC